MKIEVVISVWDTQVMEYRNRIEADNTDSIREEFELLMDKVEKHFEQKADERKKYLASFPDDDDIPF